MTLTVQLIRLALTRDVKILALKVIHAPIMLNVESPSIDHYAIVHQDGEVILKELATNVRKHCYLKFPMNINIIT